MNPPNIIKAAELVAPQTTGEFEVRTVLHTLPQAKGWVFGLFTLDHKDELARERLAHILNSHLEHLAADLADDNNTVRRFEQTLSRVNRDLNRAAQDLSMPINKFQAVIGTLTHGQIFLSGLGKLKAIFLHKTAERRYIIYELDNQFNDGQTQTWNKPLVAVLDGELQTGDIFYLGTPISHQLLGMDELQDILVTLPPAGALQRIRQFLPPHEYFGGLTFHAADETKPMANKKTNPINSLQELEHTKERTATMLGDEQTDIVSAVKETANTLSKKLSSPGMRGSQVILKRLLGQFIKGISALVSFVLAVALKLFRNLKQRLAESRTARARRHGVGHVRNPVPQIGFTNATRSFVSEISKPKIFALLGFLLVMVILGGMIFVRGSESDINNGETSFALAVKTIDDKILAADASLIYRNTVEAQKTMEEAATSLEALPRDTSEHVAEANRLTKDLTRLQAKIRGITLVEPTEIANLRNIEPNAVLVTANNSPSGIMAIGDNLNVYKLDVIGRTWLAQNTVNGPMSRAKASVAVGTDIVAVDATQQLGRINLSSLTFNPITSGTNGMASVEDIYAYNDNLYALTSVSQQIVKMRPQTPNFEAGTTWITARNTDLTSAKALAVDSDIYVLLSNGLVKFSSGREQDWHHAKIDPPLTKPVDLWTSPESEYLYVLDPGEKRVLVLTKTSGDIKAQYIADDFMNAVGFVIEEATAKITVITSTQALEFTPEHLIK